MFCRINKTNLLFSVDQMTIRNVLTGLWWFVQIWWWFAVVRGGLRYFNGPLPAKSVSRATNQIGILGSDLKASGSELAEPESEIIP